MATKRVSVRIEMEVSNETDMDQVVATASAAVAHLGAVVFASHVTRRR